MRTEAQRYGTQLLTVFIALLLAVPAQAHRKTDTVILYNGDRITGEIKALRDGLLSFSTDSMGTLSIEWKDVARVSSNYNYELRLSNGARLFGSVGEGDRPGAVGFADVSGNQQFDALEIIELRPIEENAVDRLDIYLSANYSVTKASGVQQSEFNADVSYSDKNVTTSLEGRLTLSATDEESTASSRVGLARKAWTDRSIYYRELNAGFESNDELGLDARYTVGVGAGRFFIDTNRQRLSAGIGIQALEERSADGNSQESLEAVVAATLSRWRFDTPELDFMVYTSLYPSLTQSRRVRADTGTRLRWEIVNDLFWNLNAWGSFDNSAVDTEAGQFDWGITTGLGWNF